MENQTESVAELHEGISPSETGETLPAYVEYESTPENLEAVESDSSQEVQRGEAAEPTAVPAPQPRELTESERKMLLRKFFTVRHERLTNCGHKFVPDAPPRNNCENCWWTFFNTHPALVELTDKFWQEFGKKALIGMRGEKYVKMFGRFMATAIRLKQEEEALRIKNGTQSNEPRLGGTTQEGNSVTVESANEGGETESSDERFELLEQDVRMSGSTKTW